MPADFNFAIDATSKLPGVEVSTSYRTASLKAKGKLFARVWEDGETLVLKSSFEDRDFLMRESPNVFYLTDHYKDYPYVLVHLSKVKKTQLKELLVDAWRRAASPKLIAEYDHKKPAKR